MRNRVTPCVSVVKRPVGMTSKPLKNAKPDRQLLGVRCSGEIPSRAPVSDRPILDHHPRNRCVKGHPRLKDFFYREREYPPRQVQKTPVKKNAKKKGQK